MLMVPAQVACIAVAAMLSMRTAVVSAQEARTPSPVVSKQIVPIIVIILVPVREIKADAAAFHQCKPHWADAGCIANDAANH